jgi:hypothetical protein
MQAHSFRTLLKAGRSCGFPISMRWLTDQTVQSGRSVTIVVLTIVKANIYSNSFRLLVAPWCNALGVQTYLTVQHWRTDIVDRD